MTATAMKSVPCSGVDDRPAGIDTSATRAWLRLRVAATGLARTLHRVIATRPPARLTRLFDAVRNKCGSVSVMAAVMFPVLIGMAGLVTEYGNGLLTLRRAQRMADEAAGTGALIYISQGTTAAMNAAITRMATLNGFSSTAVSPQLVTSPSGDGNQAVQVTVTSSVALGLSKMIRSGSSLAVTASGYSEVKGGSAGCIIALSTTGAGVTINGGTAISAPNCFVASNNTLSATAGTSITTQYAYYDSSTAPNSTTIAAIKAPSGKTVSVTQKLTADPLAGNSAVTTATSRLTSVAALTSPAMPSISTGTDIIFASYATTVSSGGCSGTKSGSTWTFTCPAGSTFTFGNVWIDSGQTVNFNGNGSASTTYNFSGQINNQGTAATFAAGNYNVAQGIYAYSTSTTTFNAGTYKIGASGTCASGNFSISSSATSFTMNGPVTLYASCGIDNNGSGTMSIGAGSTSNSYILGYSTQYVGNVAIQNVSSSTTTFGDATGTGSVFQANGMLALTGGSSCMTLPAAAQHDVNGGINTDGGVILGSGVWTFNGYVSFGGGAGGDVTCGGTTLGISATGVTLVYNNGNGSNASGTTSASSCANANGMCIGSGYAHVVLTAPTSGATAGLAVIGPTSSSNTAGINLTQGATSSSVSGVFYAPYAPMTLSGGASLGNGTGQCLELIVASVTMTGGTALGTTCTGLGGSATGGQAILIQ